MFFFFFSLKYPLWYYSLQLPPLFRINWQTDSMCQECQPSLKNEPQRTSFAVLIAHCWTTLHWRVIQQIVITVDKSKCCADVSSASLSSEFVWRKGSVRDKFFCFSVVFTVFYLGCLRGRSFPPPKMPSSPPPQKKILLSVQNISNCTGKNHPDATRSVHVK